MSTDIALRAMEKTDTDFLHKLFNNPDIMNYWFEEPYFSRETLKENYDKQEESDRSRSFILHNGDERLGYISIFKINNIHRKAEFAIIIDPKQQGKGYAKIATKLALDYAFRRLNLNKLFLIVDKANEKAIHVYEKIGFKREAELRDEYFVNGSYRSVVYMSVFQEEYLI